MNVVDVLHQNQFVHGDIKPRNIMVDNGNYEMLYLIDFGGMEVEPTPPKYRSSTYIPPEMNVANFMNIDGSSDQDVYALGLTLYKIEIHYVDIQYSKDCNSANKSTSNLKLCYGDIYNEMSNLFLYHFLTEYVNDIVLM